MIQNDNDKTVLEPVQGNPLLRRRRDVRGRVHHRIHREGIRLSKPYKSRPNMTDNVIVGDDGDLEHLCVHGIGHCSWVHTCDGCCGEEQVVLQ